MAAFPDTSMDAPTFKRAFEQVVLDRVYSGWTMIAPTRKGMMPVGIIFAFYSHSEPRLSPFMIVGDLVWFPWASARNKMESAVNFFNTIRRSIPMVDYAHGDENKKFFEMIARHGVMRRIGTTFSVVKGEPTALFETISAERTP